MRKNFNYPLFIRLLEPLKTYFGAFKRFSSIIASDTSDATKIMSMKLLLINLENDLLDAEREVLNQQFNMTEDDVLESFEKVQAGNVQCSLFLN